MPNWRQNLASHYYSQCYCSIDSEVAFSPPPPFADTCRHRRRCPRCRYHRRRRRRRHLCVAVTAVFVSPSLPSSNSRAAAPYHSSLAHSPWPGGSEERGESRLQSATTLLTMHMPVAMTSFALSSSPRWRRRRWPIRHHSRLSNSPPDDRSGGEFCSVLIVVFVFCDIHPCADPRAPRFFGASRGGGLRRGSTLGRGVVGAHGHRDGFGRSRRMIAPTIVACTMMEDEG